MAENAQDLRLVVERLQREVAELPWSPVCARTRGEPAPSSRPPCLTSRRPCAVAEGAIVIDTIGWEIVKLGR